MTNYTATAFTASNESSRFWASFFILVAPAVQGCVGCCCKAKPDIQGRGCKSAALLFAADPCTSLPVQTHKGWNTMNLGKQVRLQRIFNRETGRAIIVPMDHGVSVGPIEGIENIHKTVSDMADGGADAVLMHKGLCRCCFRASGEGKDLGLIIHLSASTSLSSYSNKKRLVCTVEEAIRRGADGVSVHVNLGDDNESDMLADLGEVARVAEEWSMPLLAMLYARGPRISNEFDPAVVAHCARGGVELGADIVKVPYTGDIDSFADVIAGCCVPVVIAGGPRTETTRQFLEMVDNSLKAGGSGLSVGRNVFQHPKRVQLVRALRGLVHQGLSLDEALAIVEG